MDNPHLHLFCNHTEGKLYALPDPVYTHEYSRLTRLEVIYIHTDSLIVQVAANDMGIAQMTPNGTSCNEGQNMFILPPVGEGPYAISDENKFGSFGCTLGSFFASDLIDPPFNDTYLDYNDHVIVGGCFALLSQTQNSSECGKNRTCCLASLPSATELHLRYAYFFASLPLYIPTSYSAECAVCSNNYATLFYSEFTNLDTRLFRIKITWALPVNMTNTTIIDPTSVEHDAELNKAIRESPNYACAQNGTSEFIAVPEVQGYRCKCKDGFTGDGYTNGSGCTSKK